MSEWAVFGVILTVVGFLATVIAPVVSLTRAITHLSVVVDNLGKDEINKLEEDER